MRNYPKVPKYRNVSTIEFRESDGLPYTSADPDGSRMVVDLTMDEISGKNALEQDAKNILPL